MKRHMKNMVKCILFLAILVSSLAGINQVLVPKYILKNSTWPTTSSYRQFYKMEDNSIDVLFFGSSVAVNAFIPQEIYNEYGIRSYNLGSEQQSIFLSYYWLKEALRFQSPQVVVLDTKFMWDLHPENPINTTEGLTRKCLDPMRLSDVKKEAVHNLCELDETQSELSYYLTNIRFHSRWSELQEYDMDRSIADTSELKGFAPVTGNGPASYVTYEQNDKTAAMEFVPLMQEYMDRVVELCKENGIRLVLVSLPGNEMNDAANNTYSAYARDMGVDYYNLCSTKYYNEIGAVLPEESALGHANIWGAIKISRFIGGLLQEKYEVPSVEDAQYEATREYYEKTKSRADLVRIANPSDYLNAVKNSDYAVFMIAHGNIEGALTDEVKNALAQLGLANNFSERPNNSYYAAIIEGAVTAEESSKEKLSYVGSFRNRKSVFTLKSGCRNVGASSSILIEGGEYSMPADGLNIVVYDLNIMKVIDRVTFSGGNVLR